MNAGQLGFLNSGGGVQLLSCICLFLTPWTVAHQASLSFTIPRVCSNSCPLSQWYHPPISSSLVPFSSCPQSFPASGSLPMSWLFTLGGPSIEVSASASGDWAAFTKLPCSLPYLDSHQQAQFLQATQHRIHRKDMHVLTHVWLFVTPWSPPGSSVHGILQARTLKWVAHFSHCPTHKHRGIGLERAPLVAQLVKNPPAMQETWVQSLGWEDPLQKGKTTHSSILKKEIL